ncbi:MAG: 4'-phosphopantetheinyl transferase family protein [Solirubrobacteraceae bacterium]
MSTTVEQPRPTQPVFPSVAALFCKSSHDPLQVILAKASVSVWILKLDASRQSLTRARSILSAFELARCERVVDPHRRGQMLLARAALRLILAQQLEVPTAQVRILSSPSGRPVLAGEDAPSFSFSHCHGWAAIALSSLARVGIDIEAARRPVPTALAARLLTPAEASSLGELQLDRRREFLAHWTAKEACAKVLDGGLASNLHRLEIAECMAARPRLLDPVLSYIDLRRLDLGPELHAALAGHAIA